MRVLAVNKFHYVRGGSERYYFDLMRLLREGGDEVVPFAMRSPEDEPTPYARHFAPHVEYAAIGSLGGKVRAAARVIRSRPAEDALEALLEETSPDLAHLHNIAHQLSPSILRPLARRGIPIVQTLHDYKLVCPAYRFLSKGEICERCEGRKFYHVMARRCVHGSFAESVTAGVEMYVHRFTRAYAPVRIFLAPSRFLLGKMEAYGVPSTRLRHLPYFVYPPAASTASPAPSAPAGDGGYLLYAGRLSREKGVDTLLRALPHLPDSVRVVIAGEGEERGSLEATAAGRGPGRVVFLGRVDSARLAALLSGALVAVVPSIWHENLPYAVLEAMAAGRPVVASRAGGIPELVEDGGTGFLFAPGDALDLAEKVKVLLEAPGERERMGARARARVEDEFGPERHLARLRALYAEAGAAGPGGSR